MGRTIQVNMHEAKSRLSELGKRVWEGDKIVIAKAGEPYLDLIPHRPERWPREPGGWEGQVWMAPDFDEPDEELIGLFEGEHENDG
jgi:antitoxin (DNA-binding transcriptional repressor) of toxin-antitoxin stability system